MRILIINGWTKEGDQNHLDAGCIVQSNVFANLIKSIERRISVEIFNSYGDAKIHLSDYDAFVWTGSGNNIYETNSHNKNQIDTCNKIVELSKPIWGSCWGMQVIATALGGKVERGKSPEFGISRDIRIIDDELKNSIYKNKPVIFDAPAHHSDIITEIPKTFKVITQNKKCIQSMYSKEKKIFCAQYHPELAYDYLGTMMQFWAKNYKNHMGKKEFESLLEELDKKEKEERKTRILEFKNWLTCINK